MWLLSGEERWSTEENREQNILQRDIIITCRTSWKYDRYVLFDRINPHNTFGFWDGHCQCESWIRKLKKYVRLHWWTPTIIACHFSRTDAIDNGTGLISEWERGWDLSWSLGGESCALPLFILVSKKRLSVWMHSMHTLCVQRAMSHPQVWFI